MFSRSGGESCLPGTFEVDACIAERVDDCLDGPSMNVAAWLDGPRRARVGHNFLVATVLVRDKISTQELFQAVAAGAQVLSQNKCTEASTHMETSDPSRLDKYLGPWLTDERTQ